MEIDHSLMLTCAQRTSTKILRRRIDNESADNDPPSNVSTHGDDTIAAPPQSSPSSAVGTTHGHDGSTMHLESPGRRLPYSSAPQRVSATSGGVNFGLHIRDDGEIDFRGPTSSVTFERLPNTSCSQLFDHSATSYTPSLPGLDEFRQHLDIFVEWQNASILILPGAAIDHLLAHYPPSANEIKARMVIWSVLSFTSRIHRMNKLKAETRAQLSDVAFREAFRLVTSLATQSPCIEVVHSGLILACREYSCGHENAAWVYLGSRNVLRPIAAYADRCRRYCNDYGHLYRLTSWTRLREADCCRTSHFYPS